MKVRGNLFAFSDHIVDIGVYKAKKLKTEETQKYPREKYFTCC